MFQRYTAEFKTTILDLHKQRKSARQLAYDYGVGYSTILKWVQGATPTSPGGLIPDKAKKLKKLLKKKAPSLLAKK